MILDSVKPKILSIRRIAAAHPAILKAYGADARKHISLGLITCDQDDSCFVALDEATKHSPVDVVYARSFYAGSSYASGPLSGEFLGVIAGADPDIIEEGLRALTRCLEEDARFYKADKKGETLVFPHVISSLGNYLSKEAGLEVGSSMAYLVAPPMEASIAFDLALKNAKVKEVQIFPPPTHTNFAAMWLSGSLNNCQAAAEAFTEKVIEVVNKPREF